MAYLSTDIEFIWEKSLLMELYSFSILALRKSESRGRSPLILAHSIMARRMVSTFEDYIGLISWIMGWMVTSGMAR